MSFRCA